jgi:hypothetical protein
MEKNSIEKRKIIIIIKVHIVIKNKVKVDSNIKKYSNKKKDIIKDMVENDLSVEITFICIIY